MCLLRTGSKRKLGAILAPLAIGASFLGTGCASITYERREVFEPVTPAAVESLHPGESTLGDVLARLGAPIYVWEGGLGEIVLAYGAQRDSGWAFGIKVPVVERATASLRYDDAATKLEGYIMVFDSHLKLRLLQAGLLRNFRVIATRRPERVDASSITPPP